MSTGLSHLGQEPVQAEGHLLLPPPCLPYWEIAACLIPLLGHQLVKVEGQMLPLPLLQGGLSPGFSL